MCSCFCVISFFADSKQCSIKYVIIIYNDFGDVSSYHEIAFTDDLHERKHHMLKSLV